MSKSRSSSRTQDTKGEENMRRGKSPCQNDQEHKRRDKFTTQKFKDLDARIDAINTGVNALVIVDALIKQIEPPFTKKVTKVRVSFRFKLPSQLGIYEENIDSKIWSCAQSQ